MELSWFVLSVVWFRWLSSGAGAATPWWQLDSLSMPANLRLVVAGELFVTAANLGDAEVDWVQREG